MFNFSLFGEAIYIRLPDDIHNKLQLCKHSRNIHLWGKLKIMGWVVKSTVSVPPRYCKLAEAI